MDHHRKINPTALKAASSSLGTQPVKEDSYLNFDYDKNIVKNFNQPNISYALVGLTEAGRSYLSDVERLLPVSSGGNIHYALPFNTLFIQELQEIVQDISENVINPGFAELSDKTATRAFLHTDPHNMDIITNFSLEGEPMIYIEPEDASLFQKHTLHEDTDRELNVYAPLSSDPDFQERCLHALKSCPKGKAIIHKTTAYVDALIHSSPPISRESLIQNGTDEIVPNRKTLLAGFYR